LALELEVTAPGASAAPSSTAALAAGQELTLRAFRVLSSGAREDVSAHASYFSQDPLLASVALAEGAARVRALAPGEALVTVTLGELSAELTLLVSVPTLVASSPQHGASEVAPTRETILRFSAPLEVASVGTASVFATFGGQP